MLPNGAEKDYVEGETLLESNGETGQRFIEPPHVDISMALHRFRSHRRGWFNRNDVVTEARKPRRIAAATGANIEKEGGRFG